MVTSLIQASSTVRQALSSLQHSFDHGMSFVLLKELIRVYIGVLIIKSNYCSNMNKIWTHVIHESTTIDIGGEWPVYCVLDQTLLEVRIAFRYPPDFFQSYSIVLNADIIFLQIKVLLDSFCERTSASLRENSLFSLDFNTRLIVSFI